MKTYLPALLVTALGVASALPAAPAIADTNPVDKAVSATGDAIDTTVDATVDATRSAADTVTESATWDRISGNWKQLKGSVQSRWGELTDDDVDQIEGNKESLVGKLQETYGITRMEAEEQIDEWMADN